MNAQQKVFRVRRSYNQWVANETLEDYALRFTAKSARRWSSARVSNTALGAISFLALEAIGGAITLSYGFNNAIAAIMVVGAIIFLTGVPISYHAAKQGTDIDLLTRGAGFGYIGSTITSLIYASFTFIFFALEAAILSLALELTLGIPLSLGYVISALMVIPLVTHGITLISRFQVWTQPLWIILQIIPLACIAFQSEDAYTLWINFDPAQSSTNLKHNDAVSEGFNLVAFGAASAVVFSLIAQIGEQVDFLRFLPKEEKRSTRWWLAMISAGPGWIIVGILKILAGSFLAVLALNHGFSTEEATDPNRMYLTAFNYMTQSPEFNLILLGVFVVISQLKINVTNAYAGSIAWSNFFSRITHNHPGRVVWLVFNVVIALLLMELGIYRVLEQILGGYSIVALAWVGSIVADLTINKPLGLRPQLMEFKRAHLFDINPVGVGSMLIACILGFSCHSGVFGETLQALASFIALGSTFICAPIIAWLTKGKYYIARQPRKVSHQEIVKCGVCEHSFETEDMAFCPAYACNICSLCCSLDSRCQDMCKKESRFSEQLTSVLRILLPNKWVNLFNTRLGHFFGLFLLISIVIASVLTLVYFQVTVDDVLLQQSLGSALVNVFFILLIIVGVVSWMFTLAHDSRLVAQQESDNQTKLLVAEIEAHKQTDLELQRAKELAEAANQAKSRYLTGISHELRSPLNAIMGYAQLLEKDEEIPEARRDALGIIYRSSEHLADLIEGLLDISRIEAGRLELARGDVQLNSLLEQIVNMFRVQASDKHIGLIFSKLTAIPDSVKTDEKRLRQILINLLSNAIKYTVQGEVIFSVSYRNQVAEFTIKDSGVGIEHQDLERIFRPFERVRKSGEPYVPGTGLGLTITRLLIDIMGGDLKVTSEPGVGSEFKVSLMLSSTIPASIDQTEKAVCAYQGDVQTVFIVDDEPTHRSVLGAILQPLGFNIIQAPDGFTCLDMLRHCKDLPKIFLLDISMPGMSGWELAQQLRQEYPECCILMTSANANTESPMTPEPNNGYLVKPIKQADLFKHLERCAKIEWIYEGDETKSTQLSAPLELSANKISDNKIIDTSPQAMGQNRFAIDEATREELIRMAQIGYASAIRSKLNHLQEVHQDTKTCEEVKRLKKLAGEFKFTQLIERLERSE
ncbi:MAG: ATP-binding protein [Pseudomonadales bacterium]|nr:ATP-binding protein [Pseudomonadales bacterium]